MPVLISMRNHVMPNQLNRGLRDIGGRLIAVAAITLLICLFYNFFHAFGYVNPGFVIDGDWTVIIYGPCNFEPDWCEANQDLIQPGDQILMIGDLPFSKSQADKRVSSFAGLNPGDSVSITLARNGEIHTVRWQIPTQKFNSQLRLFVPTLLLYMPFWLIGTYVLFFLRPRDTRWRLFVAFNYVTALWLAIGLTSSTRIAWSALVASALSWLLVPVYLHFHLEMPRPLRDRSWRMILAPLYAVTIAVIALEFLQLLPFRAYVWGLFVALFGSVIILLFRLVSSSSQAERLATRIMLLGIFLAFAPGILLWLLPTIFRIDSPGEQSISIAVLAIPVLPLFYTYAVYKRRLGMRESTANRALYLYAAFLLYLTILVAALLLSNNWIETSDFMPIVGLTILLAIVLTMLSFKGGLRKFASRVSYGAVIEPEEITRMFASKIPAATNREALALLLADEIAPTLFIHQSALLLETEEGFTRLYERDVTLGAPSGFGAPYRRLLDYSGRYIPDPGNDLNVESDTFSWVRLVIPVTAGTRTNGAWLFGERDPDDFYSQSDIDLLSALANQVAIAIENGNLLTALQHELTERRRIQAELENHAKRLQLLREIDQAILVAESGADIAQAALARVMQLIPCLRASVALFDFDAGEMEVLALKGAGETESRPGHSSSLRFPGSAAPLLAGKLWVAKDVAELPERTQVKSIQGNGVQSFISAPLMEADELIGALSIGAGEKNAFTDEHAEIVREVANSVAVAYKNARLVDAVKKNSRDLRQLSARLITAQETERQHISNELHDEIGQMLTGITLNLANIQNYLPESASPEIYEKLADTTTLLAEMMHQVRELSHDLRPAMLRDLGLVPTLRWYISKCATRYDLKINFEGEELDGRLPPDTETVLFRVSQEALTNVARHAAASNVSLILERNDSLIQLTVEDDGKGFDKAALFSPGSPSQGAGLVGMRERVFSLGGKLDVKSEAGHGTRVHVELPQEIDR
jgi:signal transduction histidine kinase